MLEIIALAYLVLLLVGIGGSGSQIGEPRKPLTSGLWLANVLINIPLMVLLYNVAVHGV